MGYKISLSFKTFCSSVTSAITHALLKVSQQIWTCINDMAPDGLNLRIINQFKGDKSFTTEAIPETWKASPRYIKMFYIFSFIKFRQFAY